MNAASRDLLGHYRKRPGAIIGYCKTHPHSTHTMLKELLNSLPQRGQIEWIGLRPARREIIEVVTRANISIEGALEGDRFAGRPGTKRQITLIQWEHLAVVAQLVGCQQIAPETLRRNIAVSGINLLALKGRRFNIGTAILEHTGPCESCSRMAASPRGWCRREKSGLGMP